MDATTGKALMRAQFKAVREGLIPGERRAIDEAIARNVAALPEFAAADAVFTYLSFGAEVDTRELIQRAWEAGKTVCLPRVVPGTREMRWYAVESLDRLVRSSFGVEEPPDDPSREVRPADFARPVALGAPGLPSTAKASVWLRRWLLRHLPAQFPRHLHRSHPRLPAGRAARRARRP